MPTFKEVLTVKGEQLFARALSGEATITFTKMVMGNGDINPNLIKNLQSVVNSVVTLDIESVAKNGDNTVIIKSIFSNADLENGFYYKEKGIYATDGTNEILFMYGNNGSLSEWINKPTNSIIEKTISSIITFSEADEINIILQQGIYAAQGEFAELESKVSQLALQGLPANGGNSDTVNGHTIERDVPADAKFTDTVYVHPNDANTRHVTDAEKATWNAKAPTASPTFTGTAKTTANTNYATSQLRNVILGTTVPASLANGEVYFMYE